MAIDVTKIKGFKDPKTVSTLVPENDPVVQKTIARQLLAGFKPILSGIKLLEKAQSFLPGSTFPVRPSVKAESIKQTGQAAKFIQEETARSGAAIVLSAKGKDKLPIDPSASRAEKGFQKLVFGERPLRSIPGVGEETLRGIGFSEEVSEKFKVPVGAALVALDFTTGGGKDDVFKALVKSKKTAEVSTILKKVGVPDELITSYSRYFKDAKTIREVEIGIEALDNMKDVVKGLPSDEVVRRTIIEQSVPKRIIEGKAKVVADVPVKGKAVDTIALHKTDAINIPSIKKSGLIPAKNGVFGEVSFLADSKKLVDQHIPTGKAVSLPVRMKNPMIIPTEITPQSLVSESKFKTLRELAESKGHDGIILEAGKGQEGRVYLTFDKASTVEKTTLKAPRSLEVGARKFDTAEEFVKSQQIDIPPKKLEKSFEDGFYPMANKGEWFGEANYKAEGGRLIEMTPEQFLAQAKDLEIDEIARENIAGLKEHIKSGRTLDPLTLFEINKKDVRASDGRHRAIASKELGIGKVPVVSFVPTQQLTDIFKKSRKPTLATPRELKSEVSKVKRPVTQPKVSPQVGQTPVKTGLGPIKKPLKKSYTESIVQPVKNASDAKESFKKFEAGDELVSVPGKADIAPLAKDAKNLKDISGFRGQARDITRNFEQVFGKDSIQKRTILDKFDDAKGASVDTQEKLINDLKKNVIDKYGFKKGSKESAAIMDYGEKLKTKKEIIAEFGKEKADQIIASSDWFRSQYDKLLDDVNKIRAKIYPRSPEKIIPKRKDYFRHFTELSEGFEGLKNAFETPSGISPQLAGISPFTKPKSKFLSLAQRRLGVGSTRDAIGGYLNYIPSASYAMHIDPHISRFRDLAKELAIKTEDTKNLNNFIEHLQDFANDLAGKTNPADRYVQKVVPGGRVTMRVVDWLNKRVKANVILGNASSSIAQIFNVPQGLASAKQYSVRGATKTLAQIFQESPAMNKSTFIKERYSRSLYSQFDQGMLKNTKKFAAWMVGVLDEVGTKFIWNSHYEKALAQNIPNPIRYADGITRKMVAGRGVGEVPLIQKSKLFQIAAPFQLEVGNSWWAMKDLISSRDFTGIAVFILASYLMNRVAEEIRGSDVVFDPINAIYDGAKAFQEEDNKFVGSARFSGRLAGEVLSNVPLGQTLAALYPEFGVKGVTREDLFGEGDPTRFGGGILLTRGIQDPLFKIVTPFGGGQLKKSIEGVKALVEGEVRSKSGKTSLFKLPATPENIIKAPLFGKFSTDEAREFFDPHKKTTLQKGVEQFERIWAMEFEDRVKELDKLQEKDEKVYNKVVDIITNFKKGVTVEQYKIKQLGIKNGERAQEIWNQRNKIKDFAERVKFLDELEDHNILNEDVRSQIDQIKKGKLKPGFQEKEPQKDSNVIDVVVTYAKALGVDPVTAFNRIFTGQKIRRIDNRTIIVERLPITESQAIKKERGAEKDVILDHTIPLQLGGSNSKNNLKLVPKIEWEEYTPIENAIGRALRNKKISKKKSVELIESFKEKVITADDVLNALK